MILTALYTIAVLVRRSRNSRSMNNIDKDIMGEDENRAQEPAPRPTYVRKPQPAMSVTTGA